MKRIISIALVVFFVCVDHSFAIVRAGLKGGVNFANISATDSQADYKMLPGFMIGPMVEIPLSPAGGLAARCELLYVQKGSQYTLQGEDGKIKTEELILAPFLVFRFPGETAIPFLEGGLEFGVNTHAEQELENSTENIGQDWKNNNFSINLGGGVMLGDFTADARYNLGLVDMSSGLGDVKTKTNGIQLLIGYHFLKL